MEFISSKEAVIILEIFLLSMLKERAFTKMQI